MEYATTWTMITSQPIGFVAVGYTHTVMLTKDGTSIITMGTNSYGGMSQYNDLLFI
jgi:alpha-tubulin suppressor-like RCC1 family protein